MKIVLRIFFALAILVGVFLVAKSVGVVQFAMVTEPGNEPTIKRNTFIYGTSLLTPEKGKFVLYNQNNTKHPTGVYLQRLTATEGDVIEIKDGEVFVNGISFDKNLTLNHSYIINRDFANELIESKEKKAEDIYPINDSEFIANLSRKDLEKTTYPYKRDIRKTEDSLIVQVYGKNWNADNFGPLKIPKNKVFFLGDNRNASLDSRYLGFVDKEEIVGVKLFQN